MDIKNILKDNDLKITKPRIAILKTLLSNEHGLTAEEIKLNIEKEELIIDLSTVYRNLDTLIEKNIVARYDLGESKYLFKFRKHDHNHKVICEICESEFELDCPMTTLEEIIKKDSGFLITKHNIELEGICSECQKELKKKKRKNKDKS